MHSEAYRAAMAELQRFRAVPLSEQGRGPRYDMVPVAGGENGRDARAPCAQCGATAATLAHGDLMLCGVACLKARRRSKP